MIIAGAGRGQLVSVLERVACRVRVSPIGAIRQLFCFSNRGTGGGGKGLISVDGEEYSRTNIDPAAAIYTLFTFSHFH